METKISHYCVVFVFVTISISIDKCLDVCASTSVGLSVVTWEAKSQHLCDQAANLAMNFRRRPERGGAHRSEDLGEAWQVASSNMISKYCNK